MPTTAVAMIAMRLADMVEDLIGQHGHISGTHGEHNITGLHNVRDGSGRGGKINNVGGRDGHGVGD